MAITASNITIAQNPNDPAGSVATFTRSDTGAQVTIPVSIAWSTNSTAQDVAQIKTAIQAWEAQANGQAAVNTAAQGQTV